MQEIKRNLNHSPILGDIYAVLQKRADNDEAVIIIDGLFKRYQFDFVAFHELALKPLDYEPQTDLVRRIVAAIRPKDSYPVVVNRNGADNASCPKCGHYNAMLGTGEYTEDVHRRDDEIHSCRDCGYKALVREPESDFEGGLIESERAEVRPQDYEGGQR